MLGGGRPCCSSDAAPPVGAHTEPDPRRRPPPAAAAGGPRLPLLALLASASCVSEVSGLDLGRRYGAPEAGQAAPSSGWDVVDVQRRLAYLTGGSYVPRSTKTEGGDSVLYEYVLNEPAAHGPAPRHFGRQELEECLAGRWLHVYGDSRVRFLYATLLADLGLAGGEADGCPHHTACPARQWWGKHYPECKEYFMGAINGSCWDRTTAGGGRVSFEWNQWAKAGVSQTSPLRGKNKPDILLANNGIWSVWNNGGDAVGGSDNTPPEGPEGTQDRLSFFGEVTGLTRSSKTLKLLVGYPRCPELQAKGADNAHATHRALAQLEGPLVEELPKAGWATLRPENVTLPVSSAGRKFALVWHEGMLPMSSASRGKIKWDTCDGPHTTDSLSELEMQILYNTVCS